MNWDQWADEKDDLKAEPAPVPEWPKLDGVLHLRVMNAEERIAFSTSLPAKGKVDPQIWAKLLVQVACDADGKRLFSEAAIGPLARRKDGRVLQRLFNRAIEMNGMGEGPSKNSVATGNSK